MNINYRSFETWTGITY